MQQKISRKWTVALQVTVLFSLSFACRYEDVPVDDSFGFRYPSYFPTPVYEGFTTNNPLTEKGFELGRDLFYDPILSIDSTVSCGTCHAQAHGFADHNMAVSTGVEGRTGIRNAPSSTNLVWYPSFMWDGGINHLEIMPLAPLTTHEEMASTLVGIVQKLNASPSYSRKFKEVFEEDSVTSQQLFYALAQFQGMLISASSKYDKVRTGAASFTAEEERGYDLFRLNCGTCHTEPLFSDFSFATNGIARDADPGRGRVTLEPLDSGRFRVPSLRNVELTYPYMHDGRFFTLEEVLHHYANNVMVGDNADERLTGNVSLSETDQSDIISFLKTLTDYELLSNSQYAEPQR